MVHTTGPIIQGGPTRAQFEKSHRYLDYFMCGLLALSPLALGGTHPYAALGLALLVTSICVASLVLHWRAQLVPKHFWPIYVLTGLALWTLFRSTSLGAWTNPSLAQAAWSLWPELDARGGIAPGRAGLWVVRTMTFVLAAWYATQRFSRSDRLHLPIIGIVAAAALVPIVGAVQMLTHSHTILGFYTPLDWARTVPFAGPFVNPNQAGALIGFGAITALIAARHAQSTSLRFAFTALGIPLAASVLLLDARGALLAVVVSALLWALASACEQRGPSLRMGSQVVAPLATILLAATLLYVTPLTLNYFEEGTLLNKVQMWREALQVPLQAPIFGFGPRGFQDVFAAFGLNSSHVWIEDPESGPIQLFSEHGLLWGTVIAGMLFVLVYCTYRNARETSRHIASGLVALFVFVMIETITGMGLHSSAYLLLVGTAFGVLTGRALQHRRPAKQRAWVGAGAVLVVALLSMAASPASIQSSLEDSRVPLLAELQEYPLSDDRILAQGLKLAQQTPARSTLIQQMATVYSARGDRQRATELAHGLRQLAPNYAAPQRAAIHILLDDGDHEQACTWLREFNQRFDHFPGSTLVRWLEVAPPGTTCLQDAYERLQGARALLDVSKDDIAFSMLLQLATDADASTDALVEAVHATRRMRIPELGELWTSILLERDDLSEEHYKTLLDWARQYSAELRLHIAEQAAHAYRDNAEFRVVYAESFLAALSEPHPTGWYIEFKPIIDACRSLARGNRPLTQRIYGIAGDAAWMAGKWEDAAGYYQRLHVKDLPRQRAVVVLYRQGEIAREQDDHFRAKRFYRDALDLNQNYAPALEALQSIGG